MIKIAEVLPANPTPLWKMVKQVGVDYVVAPMGLASGSDKPWDYMPLLRMKNAFNNGGFEVSVIESRPSLEKAKLGIEGRDEEIDTACTLIENMGRVGIPVWATNGCHRLTGCALQRRTLAEVAHSSPRLITSRCAMRPPWPTPLVTSSCGTASNISSGA
jgi:hypothetical protein